MGSSKEVHTGAKDFSKWFLVKSRIHKKEVTFFAHDREVWWCSLGANIGTEIDGKNSMYERPVLILRVYNKESLLVVPLTTKQKEDVFHVQIVTARQIAWVKLTQIRVISSKRLLRKVDVIDRAQFEHVRSKIHEHIQHRDPVCTRIPRRPKP